jgi:hypothetical protein
MGDQSADAGSGEKRERIRREGGGFGAKGQTYSAEGRHLSLLASRGRRRGYSGVWILVGLLIESNRYR